MNLRNAASLKMIDGVSTSIALMDMNAILTDIETALSPLNKQESIIQAKRESLLQRQDFHLKDKTKREKEGLKLNENILACQTNIQKLNKKTLDLNKKISDLEQEIKTLPEKRSGLIALAALSSHPHINNTLNSIKSLWRTVKKTPLDIEETSAADTQASAEEKYREQQDLAIANAQQKLRLKVTSYSQEINLNNQAIQANNDAIDTAKKNIEEAKPEFDTLGKEITNTNAALIIVAEELKKLSEARAPWEKIKYKFYEYEREFNDTKAELNKTRELLHHILLADVTGLDLNKIAGLLTIIHAKASELRSAGTNCHLTGLSEYLRVINENIKLIPPICEPYRSEANSLLSILSAEAKNSGVIYSPLGELRAASASPPTEISLLGPTAIDNRPDREAILDAIHQRDKFTKKLINLFDPIETARSLADEIFPICISAEAITTAVAKCQLTEDEKPVLVKLLDLKLLLHKIDLYKIEIADLEKFSSKINIQHHLKNYLHTVNIIKELAPRTIHEENKAVKEMIQTQQALAIQLRAHENEDLIILLAYAETNCLNREEYLQTIKNRLSPELLAEVVSYFTLASSTQKFVAESIQLYNTIHTLLVKWRKLAKDALESLNTPFVNHCLEIVNSKNRDDEQLKNSILSSHEAAATKELLQRYIDLASQTAQYRLKLKEMRYYLAHVQLNARATVEPYEAIIKNQAEEALKKQEELRQEEINKQELIRQEEIAKAAQIKKEADEKEIQKAKHLAELREKLKANYEQSKTPEQKSELSPALLPTAESSNKDNEISKLSESNSVTAPNQATDTIVSTIRAEPSLSSGESTLSNTIYHQANSDTTAQQVIDSSEIKLSVDANQALNNKDNPTIQLYELIRDEFLNHAMIQFLSEKTRYYGGVKLKKDTLDKLKIDGVPDIKLQAGIHQIIREIANNPSQVNEQQACSTLIKIVYISQHRANKTHPLNSLLSCCGMFKGRMPIGRYSELQKLYEALGKIKLCKEEINDSLHAITRSFQAFKSNLPTDVSKRSAQTNIRG